MGVIPDDRLTGLFHRTTTTMASLTAQECITVLQGLGPLLYNPGEAFNKALHARLVALLPSMPAPLVTATIQGLAGCQLKPPKDTMDTWGNCAKAKASSFLAKDACTILESCALLSYTPPPDLLATLVKVVDKADLSTLDASSLAGYVRGCGKLKATTATATATAKLIRDRLQDQLGSLSLPQLLGLLDGFAALDVEVGPAFMSKFSDASLQAAIKSPF